MTTTAAPRTARPSSRRPRLAPRWRKAALVAHILSAAAWVGVDVLVAVLVVIGMTAGPQTAGLAYQALGSFVVGPMLTAALCTSATGLLLGWGTRWGLVRYWWVLVKLVITVVLTVLVVVALAPMMPDVVTHGERLAAGEPLTGDVGDLVFPPVVSLAALSAATVLSVFTPWGRIRRHRRHRRPAAARSRAGAAGPTSRGDDEGGPAHRPGRGPLRSRGAGAQTRP